MAEAKAADPGSIAETARSLLLWAVDPGGGLCRVELVDEEARRRALEILRAGLAEQGIPLFELELARGLRPEETALLLADHLRLLSPGVVSIGGFAAAFPQEASLDRFLQALNYQREQLARPGLRQIWWLAVHIGQEFTRQIPDLDSWFQIQLSLTEILPRSEAPPFPDEPWAGVLLERSYSDDDASPLEARAFLSEAKDRVELAARRGRLEKGARSTLDRALRELRRAGAGSEAEAEERLLQRQYPELWDSSAADLETAASSPRTVPSPPKDLPVASLSEPQTSLLTLLAHLAPEPIPQAMLEENEGLLREATGGDLRLEEALAGLERSSLLSRGRQGDQQVIQLHHLVQAEVLSRIPKESRRIWADRAVRLILDFAPREPQDVRNWPMWDLLLPHALRAIEITEEQNVGEHVAVLMNQLGLFLQHKGLFAEAESLYRRSLAIGEARLGKDNPTIAIRLNNLAMLLKQTNRLEEAEPLMRRALAIGEASLGKDHPNVAIRLNNLAMLLKQTNRLEEAEPLLRRAIPIVEAGLGKDHPNVAISLSNLAQLLKAMSRVEEAEPLLRRALAISEANLGKDHPNVAISLNNLAALLQETKRPEEAEPLLRRALAISEANLGKDHPNVATSLNNLAALLRDTKRLEEAEPLLRRALAIGEASLGKDHPEVAIRLNNLAQVFKATSRLEEAEPLLRRAIAILESSLGKDHPSTSTVRSNLEALVLQGSPPPP